MIVFQKFIFLVLWLFLGFAICGPTSAMEPPNSFNNFHQKPSSPSRSTIDEQMTFNSRKWNQRSTEGKSNKLQRTRFPGGDYTEASKKIRSGSADSLIAIVIKKDPAIQGLKSQSVPVYSEFDGEAAAQPVENFKTV